ncbi:MAG: hypothetical protein HY748_09505 [Elusimicrobia bacterium]|nr:hypothetical protein [Elusimicrobiota bacterium]
MTLAAVLLLGGLSTGAFGQDLRLDFDNPSSSEDLFKRITASAGSFKPSAPPLMSDLAPAEWTVMVYLNAKNDLEENAAPDINEMERVGSTRDVKVVVELATVKGGAKRMLIGKDADPEKITSPVIERSPRVDMGDWRHLRDFGRWAKKRFPARHHLLVVWSHGSGWRFKVDDALAKAVSGDDETKRYVQVPELRRALQELGGVDVYASDACYMQQAEVAYEIKDQAEVVVGSEAMVDPDGFSYDLFLRRLAARPKMSAAEVGRALVHSFRMGADDESRGTLSAVKTSALPRLLSLLSDFGAHLQTCGESRAVRSALEGVAEFDDGDDDDLGWAMDVAHFARLASAKAASPRARELAAAVIAHVRSELVLDNTHGSGFLDTGGIAVYMTQCRYDPDYDRLAWSRDGVWPAFVRWAMTVAPYCKPPAPASKPKTKRLQLR